MKRVEEEKRQDSNSYIGFVVSDLLSQRPARPLFPRSVPLSPDSRFPFPG